MVCEHGGWQRAYNLSLSIGLVYSIRRRNGAEAAGGGGLNSARGGEIGLSCTPGSRLSLKFDIGLIGQTHLLLTSFVFSVADYLLAQSVLLRG